MLRDTLTVSALIAAVLLVQAVFKTHVPKRMVYALWLVVLLKLCRTAAVIVYCWNPFIWLAAIVSKRDAELACDESVAAKLSSEQRLAYARAILAQAPRRAAALSLAGPPVKERILFLSKKQRTSVLCVILALLLVVTAAGCSFAELTRQKTAEITLPEDASAANELVQETPPRPDGGTHETPQPLQAQTMTLTIASGEKYTLSDADTAAVEAIYSDDSMTPGGWESVCVYQFDIRNCSYRLDETFELAETVVRIDAEHYEYYMKRLTGDESETMRTLIDRYRPNALQPVLLRGVTGTSVTAEHIILLSSYLEEDLQTLNDLYIPPEDYQNGYYYRRISDKTYTYAVDPDAPVTIYDISQVYGAGEDRLYTFESWQDFVTAVQADEGLLVQPYVLTIQNGFVTKLEEKFYN